MNLILLDFKWSFAQYI